MSASLELLPGMILPYLQPKLRAPVLCKTKQILKNLQMVIKLLMQELDFLDVPYRWGAEEAGNDLVDTIVDKLLGPLTTMLTTGSSTTGELTTTRSGSSRPSMVDAATQTDNMPGSSTAPDGPLEGRVCTFLGHQAAGSQIDGTARRLMEIIDHYVQDRTRERHALLRQVLLRLLHRLRDHAGRMRILLHLVSSLVPQPNLNQETEDVQDDDLVQKVLSTIMTVIRTYQTDLDEATFTDILDGEWTVQRVGVLGAVAMDIMSFMEQGRYDDTAHHRPPQMKDLTIKISTMGKQRRPCMDHNHRVKPWHRWKRLLPHQLLCRARGRM